MFNWNLKSDKEKYLFHLTVDEANFLDEVISKLKIDWLYIDASCYMHDLDGEDPDGVANPYMLLQDLEGALDFGEAEDSLLDFEDKVKWTKLWTRAMSCAAAESKVPVGLEVSSDVELGIK